jgi:hypothetical protein
MVGGVGILSVEESLRGPYADVYMWGKAYIMGEDHLIPLL